MCLKPRSIRNPTKYISSNASQALLLDVPCNQCAECKEQKRQEWHFRSFHEVKNCVSHGGYVYYVTLTYAEEHVPHLSRFIDIDSINNIIKDRNSLLKCSSDSQPLLEDFYCFDSSDWRNFLKNLRRQLDYHYRGANFKYFLTSEYGTKEDYTHRPHYHVLFFVNNANYIEPYSFSELVSKCWPYGITDGLPYEGCSNSYLYKTRDYVANHVFGYNLGQPDVNNFMKCCGYVAKYITKDSTYQDVINNRLTIIEKHVDEDRYKTLKRNINMFHRQSQGFGISYLNTLSHDTMNDIINNGVCRMEDKKQVVLTIPLPMYYKRKLFYNLKQDEDGTYYWQPNALGMEFLTNSIDRNIKNLAKRHHNNIINFDESTQEYINMLLGDRSLIDLAKYQLMYRSRYYCSNDNQLENILNGHYVREMNFTDIYFRDIESDTINVYSGNNRQDTNYTNFIKNNIYNENTLADFKDFDKLIAVIENALISSREQKQKTFDFKEKLSKKFKHLYQYGG